MHITKRSWKVVKEMSLGMSTAQWFAKMLEDCLKGEKRIFTPLHRRLPEASLCRDALTSNASSRYMALVEYGGGGKQLHLYIGRDGR